MSDEQPRMIAPLRKGEEDFCRMVARQSQLHQIAFGRATELFGHIVQDMLAYDMSHGHDVAVQANEYIKRFLLGLGVKEHNLEVDIEMVDGEATRDRGPLQ